MDFTIAGILMLDGVTNGAIYALLGLAIVLVFAITRIIFIAIMFSALSSKRAMTWPIRRRWTQSGFRRISVRSMT